MCNCCLHRKHGIKNFLIFCSVKCNMQHLFISLTNYLSTFNTGNDFIISLLFIQFRWQNDQLNSNVMPYIVLDSKSETYILYSVHSVKWFVYVLTECSRQHPSILILPTYTNYPGYGFISMLMSLGICGAKGKFIGRV